MPPPTWGRGDTHGEKGWAEGSRPVNRDLTRGYDLVFVLTEEEARRQVVTAFYESGAPVEFRVEGIPLAGGGAAGDGDDRPVGDLDLALHLHEPAVRLLHGDTDRVGDVEITVAFDNGTLIPLGAVPVGEGLLDRLVCNYRGTLTLRQSLVLSDPIDGTQRIQPDPASSDVMVALHPNDVTRIDGILDLVRAVTQEEDRDRLPRDWAELRPIVEARARAALGQGGEVGGVLDRVAVTLPVDPDSPSPLDLERVCPPRIFAGDDGLPPRLVVPMRMWGSCRPADEFPSGAYLEAGEGAALVIDEQYLLREVVLAGIVQNLLAREVAPDPTNVSGPEDAKRQRWDNTRAEIADRFVHDPLRLADGETIPLLDEVVVPPEEEDDGQGHPNREPDDEEPRRRTFPADIHLESLTVALRDGSIVVEGAVDGGVQVVPPGNDLRVQGSFRVEVRITPSCGGLDVHTDVTSDFDPNITVLGTLKAALIAAILGALAPPVVAALLQVGVLVAVLIQNLGDVFGLGEDIEEQFTDKVPEAEETIAGLGGLTDQLVIERVDMDRLVLGGHVRLAEGRGVVRRGRLPAAGKWATSHTLGWALDADGPEPYGWQSLLETPASDVVREYGGEPVHPANGAWLADLGSFPAARALNLGQVDLRAAPHAPSTVIPLDDIPRDDDARRTPDNLTDEEFCARPLRIVGVLSASGARAMLLLWQDRYQRVRGVYRVYRRNRREVRVGGRLENDCVESEVLEQTEGMVPVPLLDPLTGGWIIDDEPMNYTVRDCVYQLRGTLTGTAHGLAGRFTFRWWVTSTGGDHRWLQTGGGPQTVRVDDGDVTFTPRRVGDHTTCTVESEAGVSGKFTLGLRLTVDRCREFTAERVVTYRGGGVDRSEKWRLVDELRRRVDLLFRGRVAHGPPDPEWWFGGEREEGIPPTEGGRRARRPPGEGGSTPVPLLHDLARVLAAYAVAAGDLRGRDHDVDRPRTPSRVAVAASLADPEATDQAIATMRTRLLALEAETAAEVPGDQDRPRRHPEAGGR